MTSGEIQSLLLKVLLKGGDSRLGRGQHYFHETIRKEAPNVGYRPVMEAVWALIGQGLAFIDYSQSSSDNWSLELTAAGAAAASDEEATPDDPAGYLKRLRADVPDMTQTVYDYAEEALRAYNARLYRSSAVMLGVASEAMVLEVAATLVRSLPEGESLKFRETLNSKKQGFMAKFTAFQDKVRSRRDGLPEDVANGLDLTVHAVADLIRVYRNDAGHPTGKTLLRADADIHLRLFVRYASKLYQLKRHFETTQPRNSPLKAGEGQSG